MRSEAVASDGAALPFAERRFAIGAGSESVTSLPRRCRYFQKWPRSCGAFSQSLARFLSFRCCDGIAGWRCRGSCRARFNPAPSHTDAMPRGRLSRPASPFVQACCVAWPHAAPTWSISRAFDRSGSTLVLVWPEARSWRWSNTVYRRRSRAWARSTVAPVGLSTDDADEHHEQLSVSNPDGRGLCHAIKIARVGIGAAPIYV
jgi:hypothetical protein